LDVGQLAGKPRFARGFVTANSAAAAAAAAAVPAAAAAAVRRRAQQRLDWSVDGSAPRAVELLLQRASFGVPVTIPVPHLAQPAAAAMVASAGLAPLSPALLRPGLVGENGKPMPRPPAQLPAAEAASGALVAQLCAHFAPLLPRLRPVFLFYCRLQDAGNSGAMTHPNFLALLRDVDAVDDAVTFGAVQLQLALVAHSAARAHALRLAEFNARQAAVVPPGAGAARVAQLPPPPPLAGVLSEDDFFEALVRVSELVRRAVAPRRAARSRNARSVEASDGPSAGSARRRDAAGGAAAEAARIVIHSRGNARVDAHSVR
jgi:hypothetical protein